MSRKLEAKQAGLAETVDILEIEIIVMEGFTFYT